jgi:hypothetical protein
MAKITRYQKPGQIQFAPLPYEGMINRAYQQFNKQQDMNIKAAEQLGALQGKIASYDVSEADRAQYEQFQKEAFQSIDEFSKANKGRYSDPEVAREFAKTVTSISGDPKLQIWKNNKIQKDKALQDLYKNRDSYTQFDFDNAIEEISTHQGVTPEGYNPFMGVGIKKGVDWTTSTLKLGNMVADIYKEDFQGLDDSEKMLKISQSFRDADYITKKVLPVIKQDERMWDEAKRYAKAQGLTDPQAIEQEALNYVTNKVSASAGLLAREKTQASLTGSKSGTKDKIEKIEEFVDVTMGQGRGLLDTPEKIEEAITKGKETTEGLNKQLDMLKSNLTVQGQGKDMRYITPEGEDVTSEVKWQEAQINAAVKRQEELTAWAGPLKEKYNIEEHDIIAAKYDNLKEEFNRRLVYSDSDEYVKIERDDKGNIIGYQTPAEALPVEDRGTRARIEAAVKNKKDWVKVGDLSSVMDNEIEKELKAKGLESNYEAYKKELEELAKNKGYDVTAYQYKTEGKNKKRLEAFEVNAGEGGKSMRFAINNQELDASTREELNEALQDSDNPPQYLGFAMDKGGKMVELVRVKMEGPKEDDEFHVIEVDYNGGLQAFYENDMIDLAEYSVQSKLDAIEDPNKGGGIGEIPVTEERGVKIRMAPEGMYASFPMSYGEGIPTLYKSRTQFINDFNKFMNISKGLEKKKSSNEVGSKQSLAVRNNNPGNIRGTDGEFIKYDTPEEGKQAMINDLTIKATGRSRHPSKLTGKKLGPDSTVADIISVYAPKSENDTASYVSSVQQYLGIDDTTPMSSIPPGKLAEAMSRHEDPTMHSKVFADELETERNFISETGTTIFDYEAKKGGASGQALDNFGFLRSKHGEVKTKEQALKIFEEEYMSKIPKIYPNQIRESLGDWKFNTGRSIPDILLLADGKITGNQIQNEPEHKRLWAKHRARIEKEMLANPTKWKQKIKQAKHIAYKIKDPNAYANTWKERIDIFG